MSELSQIVPEVLSPDGDQKKHNWSRFKGKILGKGARAGRPRAQTDNVRPPAEDIQAFLGLSTPLLISAPEPPAYLRRQSAPAIDAGVASRGHSTVPSVTSKAEQDQDWEERQQLVRYKKPPRRLGLKVDFVQTVPVIIGEGGDEAELPASACRKGVTGYRKRAQTEARPARPEGYETHHRKGISAGQASEPPRPATGYDRRPLPATPGITLGDRVGIVAGAIADLSLANDQGYFPILPKVPIQLRQPGPNAFSIMSDVHPALRERPKTAPEKNASFWPDAPALPPVPRMNTSFAEDFASRSFGRSSTDGDMWTSKHRENQSDTTQLPDRSAQSVDAHEDIACRPHTSTGSPALDIPNNGRRAIPAPLVLSYGPFHGFDKHDQDSKLNQQARQGTQGIGETTLASRTMSSPRRSRSPPGQPRQSTNEWRPFTPAKVRAPPMSRYDDHHSQGQRPSQSSFGMESPSNKRAFAAARESVRRNFSQPYPITSKGFVDVRRGEGHRPGSSSGSRPSSSQGQKVQPHHAMAHSPTRPVSRDPRSSPLKQVSLEHNDQNVSRDGNYSMQQEQRRKHLEAELKKEQEFSRAQEQARLREAYEEAQKADRSGSHALPHDAQHDKNIPASGTATQMVRADSAQYEQDASNSALFTFNAKTKDFATLISAAKLDCQTTEMSTMRWLRAAIWWLLGSRTDVNCLRSYPPDQQTPATIRACLNLCKTWWIITEVVAVRLNEINAANMPVEDTYRVELAELFSLTDTVVEAVKSTCLDMVKLDIMLKRDLSTREAGIWPKDVVLEVADETFPEDPCILKALLESR